MTPLTSGFPVPLTSKAWEIAQGHVQPQFDAQHNQQQFRNGLALYAVDFYLRCMAFEVESRSHPILTQLVEGAAVWVKNLGTLECCPVTSGEARFKVPADAWSDRIAYVIVHIEDHLKQAHILGFQPQPIPPQGAIDLHQLQAIEALPQYLEACQTTALSQVWSWARAQGQTVADSVGGTLQGWHATQALNLAFMGESSGSLGPQASEAEGVPAESEHQALVSKAIQLQDLDLELVMALSPKEEGHLRIELMVDTQQSLPNDGLPNDVQLTVIDQQGQVFQQLKPARNVSARPFTAALNERFSIELSYGEVKHTETFVI